MKGLNRECAQGSMDAVDTPLLPAQCCSVALTVLTSFAHSHTLSH